MEPLPLAIIPLADGFAPGLLVMVLIMLAAIVAALLIAAIIAAFLLACLLLLIACGIVSASVITGAARRSISTGFRTFFLSSAAVAGIPIGIFSLYLVLHWMHHARPLSMVATWGAVVGSLAGFCAAWMFNALWGAALARTMARLRNRSLQSACAPLN
jgi:hypothetical protein